MTLIASVGAGSKRSSHSNAYFYGFFNNKRIVLFDTLIEGYVKEDEKDDAKEKDPTEQTATATTTPKKKKGCTNDEILAVLGHELGHWKLDHVTKNIILSEVGFSWIVFATFLAGGGPNC